MNDKKVKIPCATCSEMCKEAYELAQWGLAFGKAVEMAHISCPKDGFTYHFVPNYQEPKQ